MKTSVALAALLLAAATPALAATTTAFPGVVIDESVAIYDDGQADGNQALGFVFSLTGADLQIVADIFGGELPGATAGLGPVESIAADFGFGATGALDPAISQFVVYGPTETLLTGTGLEAVFLSDLVQILLSIDGGALQGAFGALAVLTLDGFGVDASTGPGVFLAENANITINPASLIAPVALPAALPMLLAALGGLAFAGARRRARAL